MRGCGGSLGGGQHLDSRSEGPPRGPRGSEADLSPVLCLLPVCPTLCPPLGAEGKAGHPDHGAHFNGSESEAPPGRSWRNAGNCCPQCPS